jgi:hypothetical protein
MDSSYIYEKNVLKHMFTVLRRYFIPEMPPCNCMTSGCAEYGKL